MPTRGARHRAPYARVAQVGAALCFTLAALAGAVAAAGASTTSPVSSVSVRDYVLVPSTLTIQKGTTVRFTNTGQTLHHIVSDDGSFDSHPLQPGHNVTFEFDTVGVYHLHCEIHPSMTMTITVVAQAPATSSAATPTGGDSSGDTATKAAPPSTLAMTGAGTAALSVVGLVLIVLGMMFLSVSHRALSPIPAVAALPSAAALARVMGWENRFDDLLPARASPPRRSRR